MVKILFPPLLAASFLVSVHAGNTSSFPDYVAKLMDPTVDPCVDFFKHACGGWYKDAVIPDDHADIDPNFTLLDIQNQAILKAILEADKPKLGEFYASCMDTDTLSDLELEPIQADLDAIDAADSIPDIALTIAELSKLGVLGFAKVSVAADTNDATKNVLYGSQSALPLDMSFYKDPAKWATIESKYKAYISALLTLAGLYPEDGDAVAVSVAKIVTFERHLVGVSLTKLKAMEVTTTQNDPPLTFAKVNAKYPLTVGSVLSSYGFDVTDDTNGPASTIVLRNADYFDSIEALVATTPLEDVQLVATYRLLHNAAPHLTPHFHTTHWELFGKTIGGQKVEPMRAMFCTTQANSLLGELLGKYYLEQAWSNDTATQADAMVRAIRASFQIGLDASDWLDDATRASAKTKLSKFIHLLGGPTHPDLYPDVELDPMAYVANRGAIYQQKVDNNMKLLGTTVDRSTWGLKAQDVNAMYSPSTNKIIFPAAILQAPFFDGKFDAAQNFGAIGSGIGHEITHGFDNSGRKYNGDGNIEPWWSNSTSAAFDKKAQCIVNQYSSFVVKSEISGKVLGNVDGKLTLGETIADNGGLKTSFRAYKQYLQSGYDSQYTSETGEKLFFTAFAQTWCSKNTDEMLNSWLRDVHPPENVRVYGALQNNPDFARVFKCPANTFMNPSTKCLLWE
ncbi:Aste57867_11096 [Aphanomyces stellatus]|uniref:Aste57867_11096 protein n=1 Tax=Aphanomyces stellatus TaxID=120398 RepID=A0A485KS58_9STRA|nr:hypothetical protein As57867_011054 [Aphanomyces stellatus]VFT87963.1 Aste57867_11096 [Aphanomyces stellatus]